MSEYDDLMEEFLLKRKIFELKVILNEVLGECEGQLDKWGIQNHPDGTGPLRASPMVWAALADLNNGEFARAARLRCERDFDYGHGSWEHILTEEVFEAYAEEDEEKLRAELVQVAAVAVSWINAIDRRRNAG